MLSHPPPLPFALPGRYQPSNPSHNQDHPMVFFTLQHQIRYQDVYTLTVYTLDLAPLNRPHCSLGLSQYLSNWFPCLLSPNLQNTHPHTAVQESFLNPNSEHLNLSFGSSTVCPSPRTLICNYF